MWKSTFTEEMNRSHKNKTMSQSKGLCNYLHIPQLNPGSHLVLFNKTSSIFHPESLFKII